MKRSKFLEAQIAFEAKITERSFLTPVQFY